MITQESLEETDPGELTLKQKEHVLLAFCEKNYPSYDQSDIKRLIQASPDNSLNQYVNALIYAKNVMIKPYTMRLAAPEPVETIDIDKM